MKNVSILRRVVPFAAALLLFTVAGAQNPVQFAGTLASPDPVTGARINVDYSGDAAEALTALGGKRALQKVNGYRVRIFYDNSQYARDKAFATRARFSELFPEVPVHMVYENPYFKVTAGNCLTNEEAVVLWGRVKSSFNTAFVVVEEIPLSVFGEK